MDFQSILFEEAGARGAVQEAQEPGFFRDLSLDQVVAAITVGREEYDLKPFFHVPLKSTAAVRYRQAVFRDLQTPAIHAHVMAFAEMMRRMRTLLQRAQKAYYALQRQRWFLEAVDTYCAAAGCLARDLLLGEVHSEGLRRLRAYLSSYVDSPEFVEMLMEARALNAALAGIHYQLHIEGPCIAVSRYESALDYGTQVLQTFAKFQQGTTRDYSFDCARDSPMNPVEAAVLERVALLFPEVFTPLAQFCEEHARYLDLTLEAFDREVQFYLATLDLYEQLHEGGLPFCLPTVGESKEIDCREVFDVSLAIQLKADAARVVCNDFYLRGPERILVVSGANQGGKTTFARTVGQLHYLASLGCPVAAREARLFLFDRLFTHFEREESLQTLHSKLEDDLVRIHAILEQATARSLLIMNESFGSATLHDALFLGEQVMRRVMALDLLCVFVTFLDELATLSKQTVSMVSTVMPGEAMQRTFKIIRMPANGLAYAVAIAEKYHLTYEGVKGRLSA